MYTILNLPQKQIRRNEVIKKNIRINSNIVAEHVTVIDSEGTKIGVLSRDKAIQFAENQNLDLVEVAPHANPPVCKVLDYGKYNYELNKKQKNNKHKQSTLKEVRMQPKISQHDLMNKTKNIQEFVTHGYKVKVCVRFRGRELAHTQLGAVLLQKVKELITVPYIVEREPTIEGRTMYMSVSPSSKVKKAS